MTKTIRVSFDSIDEDGLVKCTLISTSSQLYVGDMVLAIQGANIYVASVVSVGSYDTVKLQIDPATWRHELVS